MVNPINLKGESQLTLLIYKEIKHDESAKIIEAYHFLNGLLYQYQKETEFPQFLNLRNNLDQVYEVLKSRNKDAQNLINGALYVVAR